MLVWLCGRLVLLLGIAALAGEGHAAATITIINANAPGAGFNDPTPAAPIGGNPGTSLGEQRLLATQYAANIWGATLTSAVTIFVFATYTTTAGCSSGEPVTVTFPTLHQNFAGAPFPGTMYPAALANKLAGVDLSPGSNDFTLLICIPASTGYLGLDHNHGAQLDVVSVFLHGMAHGFGFWNSTAANAGVYVGGAPFVWDHFLLDTTTGKLWVGMTQAERALSRQNAGKVAWTGANVSASVPSAYALGHPRVVIAGPEAAASTGTYAVGAATFGAALGPTPVAAQLMPALRLPNGLGGACAALDAFDALAVLGNVALIERGGCADVVQAKNVQNAGAIGAILIHDTATVPAPAPTGSDPTVTIPTVAFSRADGTSIASRMTHRGRRASGVTASLGTDPTQYLGADASNRAIVYTPVSGISAAPSHWDPSATPNQRMEPTVPGDVAHSVAPPADLTFRLLQDIGW